MEGAAYPVSRRIDAAACLIQLSRSLYPKGTHAVPMPMSAQLAQLSVMVGIEPAICSEAIGLRVPARPDPRAQMAGSIPAMTEACAKPTPKNKRTGSELRHLRESGDPRGLGPRFRGDDVECCLNAKRFDYFWASPNRIVTPPTLQRLRPLRANQAGGHRSRPNAMQCNRRSCAASDTGP